MIFEEPAGQEKFNSLVSHPLQSWEWGEFRKKTGTRVIRRVSGKKAFQLTIHNAPMGFKIGYFPKGEVPTREVMEELTRIGQEENCVYIQLEPDVLADQQSKIKILPKVRNSFHPLFTKYTFILDLNPSEEDLLKNMHPKTRYNIRVAQRHGVEVKEDNSQEAFEEYLKLIDETTKRQKFYAHDEHYRRTLWECLKPNPNPPTGGQASNPNHLSAHLFTATHKGKVLTAWILFVFKDKLYYPYGASSSEMRETMSSNLMAWEVIKWGKSLGLKSFDMWGALSEDPDPKDPWFGFHRFKKGYGAKHVEYAGSYDLVINPMIYSGAKIADRGRWFYLRIKSR